MSDQRRRSGRGGGPGPRKWGGGPGPRKWRVDDFDSDLSGSRRNVGGNTSRRTFAEQSSSARDEPRRSGNSAPGGSRGGKHPPNLRGKDIGMFYANRSKARKAQQPDNERPSIYCVSLKISFQLSVILLVTIYNIPK